MADVLTEIRNTRSRIVNLNSQINSASSSIQNAQAQVATLQSQVDDLNAKAARLREIADSLVDPLQFKPVADLPAYTTWVGGARDSSWVALVGLRFELLAIVQGFIALADDAQLSAFYTGVQAGDVSRDIDRHQTTIWNAKSARTRAYNELDDLEQLAAAQGVVVPWWNLQNGPR